VNAKLLAAKRRACDKIEKTVSTKSSITNVLVTDVDETAGAKRRTNYLNSFRTNTTVATGLTVFLVLFMQSCRTKQGRDRV
jgi:hypothetical protein